MENGTEGSKSVYITFTKPHGATRQQAIAKTTAKWSAYQIPSVIVVFVILVLKFSL
jgi:hypothetical protein